MNKILIVVDYQNDFVDPKGSLPVPKADAIWENIQTAINSDEYDSVIYTFDTHTATEYKDSDEQKIFPNIHCEFNTYGWDFYKIKPRNIQKWNDYIIGKDKPFSYLKLDNEYFFTKNVFNIWDGNTTYPSWFESTFGKDTEIDVCGVATNYCVFMNVMGMINRGYMVNVLTNAIEGITNFPDGTIDQSFETNIVTMKDSGVTGL